MHAYLLLAHLQRTAAPKTPMHAPLDPTNTPDAPRPPHPARLGHTGCAELIHAGLQPTPTSSSKPISLASDTSHDVALGQYGINMAGVLAHGVWRRALYLYGCVFSWILGLAPERRWRGMPDTGVAAIYRFAAGAVCYSFVGALRTRKLLIESVMLGRNAYNVVDIVYSVLTLNRVTRTGETARAFLERDLLLLCGGHPSPKAARSFAELDLLFEPGVSVRKLSSTRAQIFTPSLPSPTITLPASVHPHFGNTRVVVYDDGASEYDGVGDAASERGCKKEEVRGMWL
ncbi:hypothetical protein C8J57DRAFT_1668190 [Mycena rebaudengoi]|nr:hypothetical protein C8J57DRAFT_1668190 [Mycena rebaudengoi]